MKKYCKKLVLTSHQDLQSIGLCAIVPLRRQESYQLENQKQSHDEPLRDRELALKLTKLGPKMIYSTNIL